MIDLMLFCAKESDKRSREVLRQPFTVHGFTYATDSRILIRVEPLPMQAPTDDERVIKEMEKIALWFQANAEAYYAPLKVKESHNIPEKRGQECPTCQGTGRLTPCAHCNGEGEIGCDHCGHASQCDHCMGRGGNSYTLYDGIEPGAHGDIECENCNGFGRVGRIPETVSVKVGEAWFAKSYIDAIATLPELEVVVPGPESGLRAMGFRFKGGEGLLMPMSPPDVIRPTLGANP